MTGGDGKEDFLNIFAFSDSIAFIAFIDFAFILIELEAKDTWVEHITIFHCPRTDWVPPWEIAIVKVLVDLFSD